MASTRTQIWIDVQKRLLRTQAWLDQAVATLDQGRLLGLDAYYLNDTARGLRDEVSNLLANMGRDLDEADYDITCVEVDMRKLDKLITATEWR